MSTATPTAATTAANNPSHALLSRAHSPDTALRIHTDRVQKKPLLLRPTSPNPTTARGRRQADRLALKRRRSNKPAPLSAKQKRALGIHDIPAAQRRYALFEGLHAMWVGYMREVLGLEEAGAGGAQYVTAASAGPKLVSADFHGAEVEVVRSRCTGRVGVRGIVVKDTKFTFEVVTRGDEVKSECSSGCVSRGIC